MRDYEDLHEVIKLQRDNEGYVRDMRRQSKEAIDFVTKRDGQWEPSIIQKFRGRPRYTDDRVNPIINQIVGEVYSSEFTGRVKPAGGEATKDTAKVFDGLVRTIRNRSHFDRILHNAGRRIAVAGIAGWEIVKDYADPMSFDMDLMIQPIEDFHERVLIDPDSTSSTGEDAQWAIIRHYIGKQAFHDEFGEDKKAVSLGHDDWSDSYYYKPDNMTIGQLYYLKPRKKTIVQMNNGAVYEDDQDFRAIIDEMFDAGIEEVERREVTDYVCCQRWYSADEWLTDIEETDFNFVPVVPVYGNFEVTEGKIIYSGAVERLMDIARVHNYAFTRNVEEVALAPRSKWFMTSEQAAGHTKQLASMNTNMDPVQFYNHVSDQPPPFYSNVSSQNQAVGNLIQMTDEGINRAAGIFAANIGDNPGLQSGVAIGKQIDQGNNGTAWVFAALEASVERTCQLLVKAIPKVYDGTREVLLTQDDGALESQTINEPAMDQETGQVVYLYDLTKGQYDVTVDIGAGYQNRQEEAVEAFERLAKTDPSLMEIGRDIHLNNINAPNMDLMAARARDLMLKQGVIPEDQMTEEELQELQAAQQAAQNQPPQKTPEQIQLEISQIQAQTAMMDQQNRAQENELKMQELQIKYQGQQEKTQSDLALNSAKIDQTQQKIDQDQMKMMLEAQQKDRELQAEMQASIREFTYKLTELEAKMQEQLQSQYAENELVFNPETGEME